MKKKISIILLSMLIIMVSFMVFFKEYTLKNIDISKKIIPPQNKLSPISGEWKIEKFKVFNMLSKNQEYDETKLSDFIGKKTIFSKEYAIFADEMCNNPNYKIKQVNAKQYFFYTYKVNIEDLNIQDSNVEIISVICDGKLFYDFIKLDEENMIVYSNSIFFYLNRISTDISSSFNPSSMKNLSEFKRGQYKNNSKIVRSGILLGLKNDNSNNLSNENKHTTYRTIWIASNSKKLYPILEVQNLFVPRMSGFWWLGTEQQNKNSERIFAYPIDGKITEEIHHGYEENNMKKDILFVGNDYVAIEIKKLKDSFSKTSKDILKVLPIDNVGDTKGVKIFDIAGKNGAKALYNSAEAFISSQDKVEIKGLEKGVREDSFGVVRRNGHWIMRGRLNSVNPEDNHYADFNIKIVPPTKLMNYDEFYLSWNDIKSRIPDAKDAYTSPDKDICLILGKNYLYVYDINNDELGKNLLGKISINTDEKVVMSEWATGKYIDRWGKILKNQKYNYLQQKQ